MSRMPLEGLKVADFCWVAAGPIVTRYLADHGATVVRVESRAKVDPLRLDAPFTDGIAGENRSGFFANYNSSKYSIALDLNKPEAIAVALRLVQWADVVAENFTPGLMKRWGLDYESVVKIKPDVIYLSTSMQGQNGPHARHPGYGNNAVSLAGLTHITGLPDREAVMPYGAYTDFISPRFAVLALLAAIDYKRQTGQGQYIDVAQAETAVQFIAPVLMDCAANGAIFERRGNRDPYACPHGAYPCRGEDCWCVIAVFNDQQWSGLQEAMGDPDWARDMEFGTLLKRKANEDELDARISRWTRNYAPEEIMEMLQGRGVPSGVVHDCQGLYNDPQLKYRSYFVAIEHPEMGRHHYEGHAFRMSRTPGQLRAPSPLLGQHSHLVLTDILEMSDEEIARLVEAEALE